MPIGFGCAQDGEGSLDVVLADTVDWPVVHEQLQEHLQVQLAYRLLIVVHILAISNLVLHVFYLLLGRVESHASHHVSNSTQRYFSIQLSRFGGVLVF